MSKEKYTEEKIGELFQHLDSRYGNIRLYKEEYSELLERYRKVCIMTLTCMYGQCGVAIASYVKKSKWWYDLVEEKALQYNFSRVIFTDICTHPEAINLGWKEMDRFVNARTDRTIYTYYKDLKKSTENTEET